MKIELQKDPSVKATYSLEELDSDTLAMIDGDSSLLVWKNTIGGYLKIWPSLGQSEHLSHSTASKMGWRCTPLPKGTKLLLTV
jgi:hypothetical protein